MLREKKSEQAFSDKLRFIYLNLTFFTKEMDDCVTDFDKWIYVLKHMETLERIPFETQKKIFKRLEDIMDIRHLKSEDMEKYEESQRMVDNYNLGMYSAWIVGNEKGLKEGREKGLQVGKQEEKQENAMRFLAMGFSPEQVAQGTQLPLDVVIKLAGKA